MSENPGENRDDKKYTQIPEKKIVKKRKNFGGYKFYLDILKRILVH